MQMADYIGRCSLLTVVGIRVPRPAKGRPMRNDAKAGEEKDPVEQAFGYLERIRKGGAQTSAGGLSRVLSKSQDSAMRSATSLHR